MAAAAKIVAIQTVRAVTGARQLRARLFAALWEIPVAFAANWRRRSTKFMENEN
jgi:hypothetical protein